MTVLAFKLWNLWVPLPYDIGLNVLPQQPITTPTSLVRFMNLKMNIPPLHQENTTGFVLKHLFSSFPLDACLPDYTSRLVTTSLSDMLDPDPALRYLYSLTCIMLVISPALVRMFIAKRSFPSIPLTSHL